MKEDIKYKEYVSKIENYNSKNDKQIRRMLSEKEFEIFKNTTENIPKSTDKLIELIENFMQTKEYIKRKKDNRLMNPKKTTLREDFSKERLQEWDDLAKKADEKFNKKDKNSD